MQQLACCCAASKPISSPSTCSCCSCFIHGQYPNHETILTYCNNQCTRSANKQQQKKKKQFQLQHQSFRVPSFLPSSLPFPTSFLQSLNFAPTFVTLLLPFFPLDLLCSYLSLLACFLSFKAISTQQSSEPTTFTLCQFQTKKEKQKMGGQIVWGGGR
jgi:hypothetical protein